MTKKWICFFSQTGTEINNIRKKLKKDPDLIITNKPNLIGINKDLLKDCLNKIIFLPNKPTLNQYKKILSYYKNCIITLHGYLRIIPDEICNNYEIYNLHPGLITKYPQLKGYNPQEKAFNMKLESSGAVIHKVTPDLDSGEILDSIEINIKNFSLDKIYENLHHISTDLWVKFLKNKI